jgi:hypothetical protein
MIVVGVHLAAMQAPRRSDVESIGLFFDIGAHAAETVGERRNSIALLDSQLPRARHGQAAPVRGEGGEYRQLINDALSQGKQRAIDAESKKDQRPAVRHGTTVHAYRSVVDGSVQPYGLIVPQQYDLEQPIRLDVVLHGSTQPVGMSELRFMSRFNDSSDAPDQPWIELHPLGRVENCYRWAGETDVFEAIENVCGRYSIDRDRIVLRGMSMGASGTWHLGLKHPDFFAALGPYCGYVDTHRFSETPLPNFVKVGSLPAHQELGLHMLDSVDYAANARVVPVVACMGEKDVFFQAHVIMGDSMRREGVDLVNLISPGTGHVIDPVTQAEQLRRIAEHLEHPRDVHDLRFVSWTLKYSRCHWLQVMGLDEHYARAELHALVNDGAIEVTKVQNVNRFAILSSQLAHLPSVVRVENDSLSLPDASDARPTFVFGRQQGRWNYLGKLDDARLTGKRPGLQGPIDDAFTSPLVCVRGTGQAWNKEAQQYADASLARFAAEWHHYFRGDLPVKNDVDVTDDDVRTKNLILFGDPGSNSWIARVLPSLPIQWTKERIVLGKIEGAANECVPAMIYPNPLTGGSGHYVVLNTGHSFHESELGKLNYLLFPRWGDWCLLRMHPQQADSLEEVIAAGYFDEAWQFQ